MSEEQKPKSVYETIRGGEPLFPGEPERKNPFRGCPQHTVDHLDEVFPNECPSVRDEDRVIWMRAGAAEVVKYLREANEALASQAEGKTSVQ